MHPSGGKGVHIKASHNEYNMQGRMANYCGVQPIFWCQPGSAVIFYPSAAGLRNSELPDRKWLKISKCSKIIWFLPIMYVYLINFKNLYLLLIFSAHWCAYSLKMLFLSEPSHNLDLQLPFIWSDSTTDWAY